MNATGSCYCATIEELTGMTGDELADRLKSTVKGDVSESEYQSWRRSLPILIGILHRAGMDRLSLALEYVTPLGKRIDAVLLGEGKKSRRPLALIVELKQWSAIGENIEDRESEVRVCISPRDGIYEYRAHPVGQTQEYKRHLKRNHSNVSSGKIDVLCCQFLHNFEDKDRLFEGNYQDYLPLKMETFVKGEEAALEAFFRDAFSGSPRREAIDLLLGGTYVFGECDFGALGSILKRQENAVMIGDQTEANKQVYKVLRRLKTDPSHRELVVISGAPGTGKTVIGFHILWVYGNLFKAEGRYGSKCVYALPRSRTLSQVIKGASGIAPLYLENIGSDMDLVVIDEAHRMETLGRDMRALFDRANVVVVLQDDRQRIRLSEEGTVEHFARVAREAGIPHRALRLESQMRAGFQGNYVQCIDRLLYERWSAPALRCDGVEVVCWDSLHELDRRLHQLQAAGTRVKWYAPFCWPWSRDVNRMDISIPSDEGVFEKPWNPSTQQYRWYMGERAEDLDQVGCIYTAQGLEFDEIGMIWWNDLRWNEANSDWEVNLNACQDQQFIRSIVEFYGGALAGGAGPWRVRDEDGLHDLYAFLERRDADLEAIKELVLNTYRVLLTRAKRGVHVWFQDSATGEHFRKVMGAVKWRRKNTGL